jgi:Rrf2 family protein
LLAGPASGILDPSMRFSLQVYYAVSGVFDVAYNGFDGPVQVRVIGERQGIPTRYLEQIFQRLRRARVVKGKRGPGGGYVLSRDPAEITLRHIVEAVEGPMVTGTPPSESARDGEGGESVEGSGYRPDFIWPILASRFAACLDDVTVADLCRDAARESIPRAAHDAYSYEI